MKKGDVFEFGYGWKQWSFLPLQASQGRFLSPDLWEYMPCDRRYTTNIPVSPEEASRVFNFALNFHRRNVELGREPGFQLAHQNCSVFVRKAVEQAGIAVPTELGLKDLLSRVAPDILKQAGLQIAAWTKSASASIASAIRKYTPVTVTEWTFWGIEKIRTNCRRVLESLIALALTPIRSLLGGMGGTGGESFDEGETIAAPGQKVQNWFSLDSYRYNLPGILQEWQIAQPSTDVVYNPVRLTIVPQSSNP